jgi:hypothetical protein
MYQYFYTGILCVQSDISVPITRGSDNLTEISKGLTQAPLSHLQHTPASLEDTDSSNLQNVIHNCIQIMNSNEKLLP